MTTARDEDWLAWEAAAGAEADERDWDRILRTDDWEGAGQFFRRTAGPWWRHQMRRLQVARARLAGRRRTPVAAIVLADIDQALAALSGRLGAEPGGRPVLAPPAPLRLATCTPTRGPDVSPAPATTTTGATAAA